MKIKSALWTLLILGVLAGILTYLYYFFFAPLNISPFAEESPRADIAVVAGDYNAGNIDQAIVNAEMLVAGDSKSVPALLALASSYAQKGSISYNEAEYGTKAINTANLVFAAAPTPSQASEAYRIIGYSNEIMERYAEAQNNYDKAIELNPKNSQAYSNKGHAYHLQGDVAAAGIWYGKALALDPKNEHALVNEARLLIRLNKLPEAREILNILFNTSSNRMFLADGYQLLAVMLMDQARPDDAGARLSFEKALSYNRNLSQAWAMLGFVKLRLLAASSGTDEAMRNEMKSIYADLGEALAINPKQASAYYVASLLANIVGDKTKEAELKKLALEAIPEDITLGADEKEALRKEINAKFINVNLSPKK